MAKENDNDSGKNKGKEILLIEDDKLLMNVLTQRFTQQGYKIDGVASADEAREFLQKNPVDIILLDIILPGTDGFTFLKEIKLDKKLKKIPIIIISNLGQKEEVEKGLKLGAIDYIIKAHTLPEDIIKKVEKVTKKLNK